MTDAQIETALRFFRHEVSDRELFAALGCNFREKPGETISLLQQVFEERSADGVEMALCLVSHFASFTECVPLLCDLLLSDFHFRHEDIIRHLQDAADPYAIPFLQKAIALKPDLHYMDYDDYGSYYKKCLWALRAIDTPESIAAIREFAAAGNPLIRREAEYRLSKIP
jgi:hypothetical protein